MAKQGALLRGMKVVGMTITGASIYREVYSRMLEHPIHNRDAFTIGHLCIDPQHNWTNPLCEVRSVLVASHILGTRLPRRVPLGPGSPNFSSFSSFRFR